MTQRPASTARERLAGPRPFVLLRYTDVSGVSGTGVVAQGVEFIDGTVALRWLSDWPTSVVFHDRGMDAVRAVHGHGGATEIRYTDACWDCGGPIPPGDEGRETGLCQVCLNGPVPDRAERHLFDPAEVAGRSDPDLTDVERTAFLAPLDRADSRQGDQHD